MPEEQKQSPSQVSVDLDTSGPEVDVSVEEVKEEGVIETAPETTEQETVTEVKAETEKEDEQLEDYSKKVQSRIAKLTGKLREAQRRENAAVEYAAAVEKKRQVDQERFKQVDSDFTAKFEDNVKLGMDSAQRELSTAIEAGDAKAQVDYSQTAHGAVNRTFGDGIIASTFGAAGFNRHIFHHRDASVSYTRLKDVQEFLLDSPWGDEIRSAQTTYFSTFRELYSR